MSLQNNLVILARQPRIGTGKRRLAADVGVVEALRFQRYCLSITVHKLARDSRWRTWLALTPRPAKARAIGVVVVGQPRGDLGCRMRKIAKCMPPGPVVIVGSDIPEMSRLHIAEAFRALGAHDAVFGPASDGGYWLVGLRRRPRFIDPFDDVRWSTEHALADTCKHLANCKVGLLETLDDIDTGSDLQRYWQRRSAH